MSWRTRTKRPLSLPARKHKPLAPSAYRIRFKRPGEGSRAIVLMARDATTALRSAVELNPGEELLSIRLLEQW